MNRRINFHELSSGLLKRLVDLGMATKEGPLGDTILDLVNIRVSQINGCAFCLDMHSKQAKMRGGEGAAALSSPDLARVDAFFGKGKGVPRMERGGDPAEWARDFRRCVSASASAAF